MGDYWMTSGRSRLKEMQKRGISHRRERAQPKQRVVGVSSLETQSNPSSQPANHPKRRDISIEILPGRSGHVEPFINRGVAVHCARRPRPPPEPPGSCGASAALSTSKYRRLRHPSNPHNVLGMRPAAHNHTHVASSPQFSQPIARHIVNDPGYSGRSVDVAHDSNYQNNPPHLLSSLNERVLPHPSRRHSSQSRSSISYRNSSLFERRTPPFNSPFRQTADPSLEQNGHFALRQSAYEPPHDQLYQFSTMEAATFDGDEDLREPPSYLENSFESKWGRVAANNGAMSPTRPRTSYPNDVQGYDSQWQGGPAQPTRRQSTPMSQYESTRMQNGGNQLPTAPTFSHVQPNQGLARFQAQKYAVEPTDFDTLDDSYHEMTPHSPPRGLFDQRGASRDVVSRPSVISVPNESFPQIHLDDSEAHQSVSGRVNHAKRKRPMTGLFANSEVSPETDFGSEYHNFPMPAPPNPPFSLSKEEYPRTLDSGPLLKRQRVANSPERCNLEGLSRFQMTSNERSTPQNRDYGQPGIRASHCHYDDEFDASEHPQEKHAVCDISQMFGLYKDGVAVNFKGEPIGSPLTSSTYTTNQAYPTPAEHLERSDSRKERKEKSGGRQKKTVPSIGDKKKPSNDSSDEFDDLGLENETSLWGM